MQKTEFRSVNLINMFKVKVKILCVRAMKTTQLFGSCHHCPKRYESFLAHISFKSKLDIDARGKAVLENFYKYLISFSNSNTLKSIIRSPKPIRRGLCHLGTRNSLLQKDVLKLH